MCWPIQCDFCRLPCYRVTLVGELLLCSDCLPPDDVDLILEPLVASPDSISLADVEL